MTPNEEAALAELEWELSAPHTLEEIAEHLGVDFSYVWQVEKRALEKMRKSLTRGGKLDWKGALVEPKATETGQTRTQIRDKNTR